MYEVRSGINATHLILPASGVFTEVQEAHLKGLNLKNFFCKAMFVVRSRLLAHKPP